MSDMAPSNQRARPDLSWLLILVVLLAAVAWLMLRSTERPLNASAVGHNGLVAWLKSDGMEARWAFGSVSNADEIGLRILPIHDTNLGRLFEKPDTEEEFLATGTEYDISGSVVRRKMDGLTTLVIAPKWTRAVRHSGYAHESLLLPIDAASQPFKVAGVSWRNLVRPDAKQLSITIDEGALAGQAATLYAPQLFPTELPDRCSSLIGDRNGHLLIRCKGRKRTYFALSDPDLLNNHGLSLGNNAELVRRLVTDLAQDRTVLVDNTDYVFVTDRPQTQHRRNWSDLLRFFVYPFSLIWLGLVVITGLALWRASVRFGPPARIFEDTMRASKSVSIAAKARLLRLTGNDANLLEAHVRNRIAALSTELLGPDRGGDPLKQVTSLIKRRNPQLAAGLSAATAAAIIPRADTSAARLLDLLEAFETQVEKVLHEFGRTPGPR